ncbi:MAG: hypothetical protein ABSE73_22395 [Planctomycetota bacterium]
MAEPRPIPPIEELLTQAMLYQDFDLDAGDEVTLGHIQYCEATFDCY